MTMAVVGEGVGTPEVVAYNVQFIESCSFFRGDNIWKAEAVEK
jgi:hypothetical protein